MDEYIVSVAAEMTVGGFGYNAAICRNRFHAPFFFSITLWSKEQLFRFLRAIKQTDFGNEAFACAVAERWRRPDIRTGHAVQFTAHMSDHAVETLCTEFLVPCAEW